MESSSTSGLECGSHVVDRLKHRIAERLRQTADKVADHRPANSMGNSLLSQAPGWINDAADRVERIDPDKIKTDFEQAVRRNPEKSLLIAAATGAFLAAILRRH